MSKRAALTCKICEVAPSKYKCPTCLLPYCSVVCYHTHKETPCANPSSTEENPALSTEVQEAAPKDIAFQELITSSSNQALVEVGFRNKESEIFSAAAQMCAICEIVLSKYKCPTCLLPCCSVVCYLKHKETPCAKPSSTEENPALLAALLAALASEVQEAAVKDVAFQELITSSSNQALVEVGFRNKESEIFPAAAQMCAICEIVLSKYKCPTCLLPFCSVVCYHTHKETPCANPSSTEENPALSTEVQEAAPKDIAFQELITSSSNQALVEVGFRNKESEIFSAAAQMCAICEIVLSKYKCPTCLLPFCSVVCYSKHKETPCAKLSST